MFNKIIVFFIYFFTFFFSILQLLLFKIGLILSRSSTKNTKNKNNIFMYTKDKPFDYIRVDALESVADKINNANLEGYCAELGVYEGYFSSKINEFFPERKLYLFDTFTGFNNNDIDYDKNKNYLNLKNKTLSKVDNIMYNSFKNASIDRVLKKMKYKNNCIIKKGYFPGSAKDVDERFIFVSLDVDLYKPTIEGLNYFYDRLNKGGFIFVHDYYSVVYQGANYAVNEFAKERNINFFILPDVCGTAIIIK